MSRWWPVPRRRDTPELMDAPGLPADEVADAYRVLRRVNRQLGNRRTLRRELRRWLDEERPGGSLTLLDLGSGSGDLPDALRRDMRSSGRAAMAVALDREPTALALAGRLGLVPVRADALRLPLPDRSIDLVTAIKFAHHFHGPALTRLLAEMARVARRRVVVLDIQRHWLAYGGFVAWSRVFTRNRLIHHDGPVSVLRGFTLQELLDLASPLTELSWTARYSPPFQIILVGRRTVA